VQEIRVEVDIKPGLPVFSIIGLADKQINEAKERVRAALRNSGFKLPRGRITVNLSPSSLPKRGTCFDLAIALALLGYRSPRKHTWILGELSLNGTVKSVQHLLPMLREARNRATSVVIPASQKDLAHYVEGSIVALAENVKNIYEATSFQKLPYPTIVSSSKARSYLYDQVRDQPIAKRVIAIALAGKHTLCMSGPPGVGKTMLAEAASELLPALCREEIIEVASLHAFAGKVWKVSSNRPFIHPHHRISSSALLGGGSSLIPGEVALAYGGILFLDEFTHMDARVREMLRQPMQEKEIRLSGLRSTVTYPISDMIWAAYNSCPCGRFGAEGELCTCEPGRLLRYRNLLSQALLERFDLHIELTKPKNSSNGGSDMKGAEVAHRIKVAWDKDQANLMVDDKAASLLEKGNNTLRLSPRVQDAVVRVARTIALFDGKVIIDQAAMQEALQYRHRQWSL
jgi:magnesium chelatase family protein